MEWGFLGAAAIMGAVAGLCVGRMLEYKGIIRALLWIIGRRMKMGVFFNPTEQAIIQLAVKKVL